MTTIAQQNVALFLKNLRADPLTALKPPQSAVNSVAQWFKERSQPKKIIIKRKKKKKTTTRHKKMTAGMSVLMTTGLMERVRGFRMGKKTIQITPKMLKNYLKKNKKDVEDIFNEEILYPAERRWNDSDYYGELKIKARKRTNGMRYTMPVSHYHEHYGDDNEEFGDILDYQQWNATKGSLKKGYVAMRKALKEEAEHLDDRLQGLFGERSFGEGLDTTIHNAIVNYAQENYDLYREGIKTKTVWVG